MLLVTGDRQSTSAGEDRYPFKVVSGVQPIAAFAKAEDADRFIAWCENKSCSSPSPL